MLTKVTENCIEDVCPKFTGENWNISSFDCFHSKWKVTLDLKGLPEPSSMAIEAYCNTTNKCSIPTQPSSSPSPSPSTSQTVLPDPSIPPEAMPNWMLICFITIGVLAITFVVLFLLLVTLAIKRWGRWKRVEPHVPDGGESGGVHTTGVNVGDPHVQDGGGSEGVHTIRVTELTEDLQSETRSFPMTRQPVSSSRVSNHDSVSTSTNQSRTSGRSGQSHRSGFSHKPRNPSTLTSVSHHSNSNCGPTVVINLRMDQTEQISFPVIMKQLFDELGALQSEQQTHESGIGSTNSTCLDRRSCAGSQQRSLRSSGYGGSQAPVRTQDPNILNPHGKSGFISDSSDCSSVSTSSSSNSLHGLPHGQNRHKIDYEPKNNDPRLESIV